MNEPHPPGHGYRLNPYPDPVEVTIARLEVRMDEADRRAAEAAQAAAHAVERAEAALSHRLDVLDDLRQIMADQQATFATRDLIEVKYREAAQVHAEQDKRTNALGDRLTNIEASQRQTWRLFAIALALIPIGLAAISLIDHA